MISSYPFDDQDTTETDYSRLFRELQDSGVADSIGGASFAVTADASALSVTVAAGFAIVRGHAVLSTAAETVAITAPSAQTRIDRIVLRLDPVANGVTLAVLTGTPGSGAPPLVQTDTGIYEVSLALVTVEPAVPTIAANAVKDDRTFVGSRVGAWSTATRPARPRTAQLGFNITTLTWEYFNGVGWKDLAPTVTWNTVIGKPGAFTPAAHRHNWNDLDDRPDAFTPAAHSHDWNSITSKPGAFPPSGHRHHWDHLDGKPGTYPPDGHSHNYAASNHSHNYADRNHGHEPPWTVGRANGSDRVHGNTPQGSGWYSVWVDGNKNFCKNTSSIRYKTNVRDHPTDPDAVLQLRPRLFDRKDTTTDDGGTVAGRRDEYGLIAEEVHELLPELTVYDEDGRIDSLRYDLLAVALIPLLQRQERRIAELERRLDQLGEDLSPCLNLGEPE